MEGQILHAMQWRSLWCQRHMAHCVSTPVTGVVVVLQEPAAHHDGEWYAALQKIKATGAGLYGIFAYGKPLSLVSFLGWIL